MYDCITLFDIFFVAPNLVTWMNDVREVSEHNWLKP